MASAECVFDVFRGIVRLIQGMLPASCGLGMITGFPATRHRLQGETGMKLYYHPVSTTSRPVWLFIAESDIKCELRVIDLMKGEHYQPEFEIGRASCRER